MECCFISLLFPPKILNLRIKTSIENFFADLELYFIKKGWEWVDPEKIGDFHWRTPDFDIKVISRNADDSIRAIQYGLNIPGVIGLNGKDPIITFSHSFRIELPREYPARVDKIRIIADSQIFHPRFSISGLGEACLQINGEIDRILMDMIFQVLYDPDRVRPPKYYNDADFGRNSSAMKWYQNNDPKAIYELLLNKWLDSRNKKIHPKAKIIEKETKKKGLRIIE
ncbi:MAG: hypothetical protein HeimC3_54690 [Candidatus Heimdallarchaeota archaeon LC_3]|nr:MAG: hypothetical protein HeimC3_54690 [Candidatus Heimdallarchaeota archaeon LC_3]